jgi:hypothetical protein
MVKKTTKWSVPGIAPPSKISIKNVREKKTVRTQRSR